MDCVCGCDRDIPKKFADRNFIAAGVALELLAWDKNRALSGAGPDGREGLIARGVECYERLLYALHGEGSGDPDADSKDWLAESARMRAGRSDMTKRRFLGPGGPNLSEDDMARLDRRHPERSFTGGGEATSAARPSGRAATRGPAVAAPPPVASAPSTGGAEDLVDRLERLRALRDAGALTDEEFAAAKARLLGRD